MLVMLVVTLFSVVGEVAVEENLPAALERWSGPATVHAEKFCDWDEAFCERVGKAAFASFET